MGAAAFTTGDHVAFAGPPSLHTAAHEAAHVIQQRAGVHLTGGVGEPGDRYERHADAVADLVVRGRSAAGLLADGTAAVSRALAGTGGSRGVIQRVPAGAGAAATTGTVRRGSHNERVRTLQERLNARGQEPPLKIDSIFGPLTEAATRAFQARNGLNPDGVAGHDTWAALEAQAAQPDIDPNEAALGQHAVDLMDQNNLNPHTLDQGVHYYYNYRALCFEQHRPDLWKDDYQSGYADPQYFDRIAFMDWRLKRGLSAAAGLKSWLRGLTIAECNSAVVAIEIDSVRAAIGDTKFDTHWGSAGSNLPDDQRLRIKPGIQGTPVANLMKRTSAATTGDAGTEGNRDVKPGEWYYFYNHPKYLLKHPGGAWQGENALYMGRDDAGNQHWSGMGASRVTEAEMLDEMVQAYNADRDADDEATLEQRFPQGPPPKYDPASGEFPHKISGPEEILSAPPYELDGTTRKGGFLVEAGRTLDEAQVKALADE